MTARDAVKTVVSMAQTRPVGDAEGDALRIVLGALKERDQVVIAAETPIRLMTARLEGALG